MIASRLPDGSRRRFQQQARATSSSIGLGIVVAVGIGVAAWTAQSLSIDATRITSMPAAFGFTMWSGHPARGHPGFDAPLRADAASTPLCTPDRANFAYGLANLKLQLGEVMGEPLECERAVDSEGNTVQLTTTGLAAYEQRTQTVTFTDGWRHWAFARGRLVTWDGDAPASVQVAARRSD